MPDEFPIEPAAIEEKHFRIGTLTLSDGQQVEIKDIAIDDTTVTFRQLKGYTGDCALYLRVTDAKSAKQEIMDALEIELVSKTKVDPIENAQKYYIDKIQEMLDSTAQSFGYDNIISMCTYVGSSNAKFAAEGKAALDFRDKTWEAGYQILSDVAAGKRPVPTIADVVAELPTIDATPTVLPDVSAVMTPIVKVDATPVQEAKITP